MLKYRSTTGLSSSPSRVWALCLLTLSTSFLGGKVVTIAGAGAEDATMATTSAAFNRDVVGPAVASTNGSPPPLGLVSSGAAATAVPKTPRWRWLGATYSYSGGTSGAPASAGNPTGSCNGLSGCISGCPSHFYKVTGSTGETIDTNTCGNYNQRTYVWKGSNDACSTFTCISTLVAFVVGWLGLALAWLSQHTHLETRSFSHVVAFTCGDVHSCF